MKKAFFIVNPKSYLYGKKLYDLAMRTDELSKSKDIKIYFTAPFIELREINKLTNNIILTAQHSDSTPIGRGMGHIVLEMLKDAGVGAVVLSHAEHKIDILEIEKVIKRAKELGIETIVCADSYEEVEKIAKLNPTIMLCEPTSLIGTGQLSSEEYMKKTTEIIRNISKDILVMQAAGVVSSEDVYNILKCGYDGTGCTSGIVLAKDMFKILEEMIDSVDRVNKERKI